MRTPTRLATSVLLALALLPLVPVQARVPEPDHIFFGVARRSGTPITTGTITVIVNGGLATVASFTLDGVTSNFVLRVPIDSLAPQDPGTARPGDTARIYVDGKLAATTTVGERGTATLVDADETGATVTLLASASNPAPFGVGIALTATVSPAAAGGGVPTGDVVFKNGTTVLATVPVDAAGKARSTVSTLGLGTHDLFAEYVGAGAFGPSRSDSLQEVVLSQTATSLARSPRVLRAGQPLTLDANVRSLSIGVGTPAGTVVFRDGTTVLGAVPVSLGGLASLNVPSLTKGTHLLSADYTGSSTFFGSRGGPLSQSVTDAEVCSVASFAGSGTLAVGTAPRSIATGDWNGDGHQDIAVANSASNDVTLLLGDGLGGFLAAGPSVPAGLGPQAVVAGDFNGDGKTDLAVAARDSNEVRILLGDGLGQFTPGGIVSVPTPRALVGGDFNLDGHFDVATANQGPNTVTLLLGDGAGSLSAQTPVAVGSVPIALVTGDINGDGRPDLAVANSTSSDISVLLGDGLGGLAGSAPIAVSSFPAALAMDDFNNDGNQDLITVQAVSSDLHLFLGDGTGGFVEGGASPFVAGSQPRGATVGDFDLDGKLDLAVVNAASGDLSILAGDGAGGFTLATTRGVGTAPFAVVVDDFNADGRPDLATANSDSNDVSVQLSDCTAGTQTVAVTSVTPSTFGQIVTFTATVAPQAPSAGQPTGSVSFTDGGTPIGVGSVNVLGQAILTTDTLTPGTHSIAAVYAGDAAFGGSASTAFDQVILGVGTLTTIGGAPAAIAVGEALTLTATVQPLTPGLPTATGDVVFFDGTNPIGTAALTGSVATLVTRSLDVGSHTLRADYPGDANYNPSTASMPYTVAPATNATATSARSIEVNSTSETMVGGATSVVWYRARLFANRSYQISAWPVEHEQGVNTAPLLVALFSDDAGTVPAAGVSGGSGTLEGTPNQAGDGNPFTATIRPSVSGVYKIRVEAGPGGAPLHAERLLLRETTLFAAWTSRAAGFEGVIELHNNTDAAVSVTLRAFDGAGALQGAGLTFTLAPDATDFRTATQVGVLPGAFAGIVLTHDGAFGAVSGTIVTLNPANGLSFDSPFVPRSPTVTGPPVR